MTDTESKASAPSSPSSSIPSTMSAIQITGYGDPATTLQLNTSVPTPFITNVHDVLIRVHSVSINPVDYKIAGGALTMWKKMNFPYIPGFDVAGDVVGVGDQVKNVKIGDRVYGDLDVNGKTMANYCIGKDYQLATIPSSINYSQAASIPLATLTSYQGLFVHGGFKPGNRVLVLGGASATGQAAVQLAKAGGGWVATTASTRNIEIVQSLGADLVIDYTKQKWEEVLKDQEKFHIVYDTVGEEKSWERGSGLVKKDGIFLQIAQSGDNKLTLGKALGMGMRIAGRKIASWFGAPQYNFFLTDTSASCKQLEVINQWINEGKYRPTIDKIFPFTKEGAIDLFHASASGKAQGKLVMEIIPSDNPTPAVSSASSAAASSSSSSSSSTIDDSSSSSDTSSAIATPPIAS